MPTFAIKIPANINEVHSRFDELVNFQIVSKEQLYDWLVVPLFGFVGSDDLLLQEVQMAGDEQKVITDASKLDLPETELDDTFTGVAGED